MAAESGDSTSILTFAARGLKGTWIRSLGSDDEKVLPAAKKLIFSDDGLYLAICDEKKGVSIVSTSNYEKTLWEVLRPRTAEMIFSPSGKYIALWELAKVQNNQEIANNFHIYDWKENKLVLEALQKKQFNWSPQWSDDEFVCSRYSNGEIMFYEDHDFSKFKCRLSLANISSYSLARSKAPYHVSVSVSGSGKGDPSFVRLFRYPKFSQADALANKSFFKANKTELFWNPAGTALVFLTVAEEKTSESYFGEQELHFISTKQESCIVPRDKRGPVYSVTWNPNSKEFCVVYGFMPSKVTLYNLKCDPIFDFGTGPRNLALYNPFGSILCLAGFGALSGNMEFWDLAKQKLLTSFSAVNTTHFQWCPDGIHFVTATLSPRLRVENGYKLWHYSGKTIKSWQTDVLLDVLWTPLPKGALSAPEVKAVKADEAPKQVKAQAYVPPMRRNAAGQGAPASTSQTKYREAYELPSNLRQDENKEISKSALKNKKKRDQKKAKKLENAQNPSSAEATTKG